MPRPAILQKCKHCGLTLASTMIPAFAAPMPEPEPALEIFRHTLAVTTCPKCDGSADPSSAGLHFKMREGD